MLHYGVAGSNPVASGKDKHMKIKFGKWYISDTVAGRLFVFPLWELDEERPGGGPLGVFRYNVELDFTEYAEVQQQFLDDFKEVSFQKVDHSKIENIIHRIFTAHGFDMTILFSAKHK